jgi:hypothetical protein
LLGPDEPFDDDPFDDDPLLLEEPAPLSDPDLLLADSDELPPSDEDPDDSEPLFPFPAPAPTLPLRLSFR